MSLRSLYMQISEYSSYVPYSLMCFLMKSDHRQVMAGSDQDDARDEWVSEASWRCIGSSVVEQSLESDGRDEWVPRG